MHEGTRLLGLEMRRRGARHVETALEVNLDHRIEILLRHLVEDAVAQVAGVVDDAIDSAIQVERILDDRLGRLPHGHTVGVGGRRATERADFVHRLLGRPGIAASAVDGHTQVIHDDLRALARGLDRDPLAHASACAGDHDDFSFQQTLHVFLQKK